MWMPSDEVVIFGAGPIGLLALVVAKVAGARVMVVGRSKTGSNLR